MISAVFPFTLDQQAAKKPSTYKLYTLVGAVLLMHAAFSAYMMREGLQAHHHHHGGDSSIEGAKGHRLPLWLSIEVVAGFVLAVLGILYPKRFGSVLRCDTTQHFRYEHSTFTGYEFAAFNHRGIVQAKAPAVMKR